MGRTGRIGRMGRHRKSRLQPRPSPGIFPLPPFLAARQGKAMRLFLSAGEPSGDLHGANLVRELRRRRPGIEVFGFGGEKMAEAGCEIAYPLAETAIVGILPALAAVPRLAGVLG